MSGASPSKGQKKNVPSNFTASILSEQPKPVSNQPRPLIDEKHFIIICSIVSFLIICIIVVGILLLCCYCSKRKTKSIRKTFLENSTQQSRELFIQKSEEEDQKEILIREVEEFQKYTNLAKGYEIPIKIDENAGENTAAKYEDMQCDKNRTSAMHHYIDPDKIQEKLLSGYMNLNNSKKNATQYEDPDKLQEQSPRKCYIDPEKLEKGSLDRQNTKKFPYYNNLHDSKEAIFDVPCLESFTPKKCTCRCGETKEQKASQDSFPPVQPHPNETFINNHYYMNVDGASKDQVSNNNMAI